MKKIKAYDIETNELIGEYKTQQEVADAFDLTWEAVKGYFYRKKIYGDAKILDHKTKTWCYLIKEDDSKSINYKDRCEKAIEEINYMITNADITEISAIKLKQILGDKDENIKSN